MNKQYTKLFSAFYVKVTSGYATVFRKRKKHDQIITSFYYRHLYSAGTNYPDSLNIVSNFYWDRYAPLVVEALVNRWPDTNISRR